VRGPRRFAESMGCVSEFELCAPLQGHPRGCPFCCLHQYCKILLIYTSYDIFKMG